MRILYVEDNPANLFLVKRVAKIGGHEVINYIDGEDALANFSDDNPDLVLMDIQLAGELSGLDVVQQLRLDGYQTPIIAVTAYAMVGDRERFLAAGCDDYLAKPLPIPRLVEIIQQYNASVASGALAVPSYNDGYRAGETESSKAVTRQLNVPDDASDAPTVASLDHQDHQPKAQDDEDETPTLPTLDRLDNDEQETQWLPRSSFDDESQTL